MESTLWKSKPADGERRDCPLPHLYYRKAADPYTKLSYGSLPVPATPMGELRPGTLRSIAGVASGICDWITWPSAAASIRGVADVLRRLICDRRRSERRCGRGPGRIVVIELHTYGKSVRKGRSVVVIGQLAG